MSEIIASDTWKDKQAEFPLQFSCYRRCGREFRRLQLGLLRSSLGIHWYQTWDWIPWSRWTFGNLSFSALDLLELLLLSSIEGEEKKKDQ